MMEMWYNRMHSNSLERSAGMEFQRKINIITGHYGSGKTNLAVNLALDARKQGKRVTVIDLDIVNPYFRTADFAQTFAEAGIRVVLPTYANTNLDIPALTGAVDSAFDNDDDCVIIDVGGDDAGAIALGRYAPAIQAHDYALFYVVNRYRYLTSTPEEGLAVLADIAAVSRLSPTGILNNANLGEETTAQTVEDSLPYAEELAAKAGLPLLCTAYDRRLGALPVPDGYPVEIFVKKIWEP